MTMPTTTTPTTPARDQRPTAETIGRLTQALLNAQVDLRDADREVDRVTHIQREALRLRDDAESALVKALKELGIDAYEA